MGLPLPRTTGATRDTYRSSRTRRISFSFLISIRRTTEKFTSSTTGKQKSTTGFLLSRFSGIHHCRYETPIWFHTCCISIFICFLHKAAFMKEGFSHLWSGCGQIHVYGSSVNDKDRWATRTRMHQSQRSRKRPLQWSAKIVLWSLKSFKHKIFGFFLHKLFCNRHWQYRNETFEHYVGALSTRAKARTCIHSFRLLSNVKSVIYNHFL